MPCEMAEESLLELTQAVEQGRRDSVVDLIEKLLQEGHVPNALLHEGLLPGIKRVTEKFDKLEAFLPDIIFASEALNAGVDVLNQLMPKDQQDEFRKGTVVIGTVEGDIHDVGKTIVASLMKAYGFIVYDLGINIPSETFIQRACDTSAHIIALSCLMTTTLQRLKEVIEDLDRLGLRSRFKLMVGGGAVTAQWAGEIGADGYGLDAVEAVEAALKLTSKKPEKSSQLEKR